MTALLSLEDIEVVYGAAILAVRGVSLTVGQGEIVALLGANGAGKSSTLRAVSNLLPARRGRLARGRITFDGRVTTGVPTSRLVSTGLVQVLEGRHCFRALTVEENLVTGARRHPPRDRVRPRPRLCAVSPAADEAADGRRADLGRGAADGRHRTCADGPAAAADPG
jgi:branched-chain amino acid transport system ATP-binding protein